MTYLSFILIFPTQAMYDGFKVGRIWHYCLKQSLYQKSPSTTQVNRRKTSQTRWISWCGSRELSKCRVQSPPRFHSLRRWRKIRHPLLKMGGPGKGFAQVGGRPGEWLAAALKARRQDEQLQVRGSVLGDFVEGRTWMHPVVHVRFDVVPRQRVRAAKEKV